MTSRFPPFAFVELVSPYNKKNITRWLEDMNFMFEWQEQYLTRSLRSLVRYCSCHSNIKFISSRHRVISSIYCLDFTCLSYTCTFFALYNCYYLVTFPLLLCYLVTLFPFDSVTLLLCYLVTLFPNFYSVTLLPCYSVPLLLRYLLTLLL